MFPVCVQQHFSGPVLSGSVYCRSGGLQSNICKSACVFCNISFKLFGVTSPVVTASVTRAWALSLSLLYTRQACVSLIRTTKCYRAVSWLWTRSRYVLISCNFFEMLVKGVKRRGGGRRKGRAGCWVLLVKGNGARCRWGFPNPNMCSRG